MLNELFSALDFSAQRHSSQRRKDSAFTPYINHVIEVAAILARHGVTDRTTLLAAILHDTIEDTDTTPDELAQRFGPEVRDVVLEVTDDKSLPKEVRKELQVEHAPTSPTPLGWSSWATGSATFATLPTTRLRPGASSAAGSISTGPKGS